MFFLVGDSSSKRYRVPEKLRIVLHQLTSRQEERIIVVEN